MGLDCSKKLQVVSLQHAKKDSQRNQRKNTLPVHHHRLKIEIGGSSKVSTSTIGNEMTNASFATMCGYEIHSDMLIRIIEYIPYTDLRRTLPYINRDFLDLWNRNDILYKILLEREYYLRRKYLPHETWKKNFNEFNPIHKRIFEVIQTNTLFKGLRNELVMECCQLGVRIETTKTMTLLEPTQVRTAIYFLLNGEFINNGERTSVGEGTEKQSKGIPLKFTKSPPAGHVWAKAAKRKKTLFYINEAKLKNLLDKKCTEEERQILLQKGVDLEEEDNIIEEDASDQQIASTD